MFTDIRKLRTFVAVVEEGSLTGAAERLNVAQPWISVQIKQLEEMLDLVLLERSRGKAVQLSPAGRKFIGVAQRLLASCELASKEIASLLSLSVHTVETHRRRIRKKLGLPADASLTGYLAGLVPVAAV